MMAIHFMKLDGKLLCQNSTRVKYKVDINNFDSTRDKSSVTCKKCLDIQATRDKIIEKLRQSK